ncbi:hypothetical protein HZB89_00895, partial [archaeon]|nr:hypothetical protein [archaeon]
LEYYDLASIEKNSFEGELDNKTLYFNATKKPDSNSVILTQAIINLAGVKESLKSLPNLSSEEAGKCMMLDLNSDSFIHGGPTGLLRVYSQEIELNESRQGSQCLVIQGNGLFYAFVPLNEGNSLKVSKAFSRKPFNEAVAIQLQSALKPLDLSIEANYAPAAIYGGKEPLVNAGIENDYCRQSASLLPEGSEKETALAGCYLNQAGDKLNESRLSFIESRKFLEEFLKTNKLKPAFITRDPESDKKNSEAIKAAGETYDIALGNEAFKFKANPLDTKGLLENEKILWTVLSVFEANGRQYCDSFYAGKTDGMIDVFNSIPWHNKDPYNEFRQAFDALKIKQLYSKGEFIFFDEKITAAKFNDLSMLEDYFLDYCKSSERMAETKALLGKAFNGLASLI